MWNLFIDAERKPVSHDRQNLLCGDAERRAQQATKSDSTCRAAQEVMYGADQPMSMEHQYDVMFPANGDHKV